MVLITPISLDRSWSIRRYVTAALTRIIGVMRTIGFYGGDLRMVLWAELLALGCAALLAGFLLAWILGQALTHHNSSSVIIPLLKITR